MARHPPIRQRVQALGNLPVALWRRLVGATAFGIAWLTVWVPGAAIATALAAATALWLWAGSASSLEQAVNLARPWVPALHTLTLQGVDASLRHGGRVGQLTWTDPAGLRVVADDIDLSLDLRPLIKAQPMRLTLHMAMLTVHDDRPPSDDPPEPPQDLTLPLGLHVQLGIDHLRLAGKQPVDIRHIRGTYLYEGGDAEARHLVSDLQLEIAQGRYTAQVALQAQAPMALSADIKGTLETELPALDGSAPHAWQSPVAIKARGLLRHEDPLRVAESSITVLANLGPENAASASASAGPSLAAEATLRPWQRQPLHGLSAQLQRLNLAALWPQLPTTLLQGQVQAAPPASGADPWQLTLALTNSAAGPWDQGLLPVSTLDVRAKATPQLLDIERLRLQLGQGSLSGQGRWSPERTSAQAELTLLNLPLHELHTFLAPRLASGRVSLSTATAPRATGAGHTTQLAVDIRTAPGSAPSIANKLLLSSVNGLKGLKGLKNSAVAGQPATAPPGPKLSVESLLATGTWDGQQLRLQQLALRAAGASLQGQGSAQPQPFAAEGQWRVQAPGLEGQVQGSASAQSGSGKLSLTASNLALAHQWLRRLPLPATVALPAWPLEGDAQIEATWQGGWAQAKSPTVQASLSSRRLSARPDPQRPAITTQSVQLDVAGNPSAADIRLSAGVFHDRLATQLQLNARSRATPAGQQVTVQPSSLWLRQGKASQSLYLETAQALVLDWQADRWKLGPGSLQLSASATTAPPTQRARADAQASARLRWDHISAAKGVLSAQGEVERLALDWLDAIPSLQGPGQQRWLADAGVRSDLVWGGPWRAEWPYGAAATAATTSPELRINLRRLQGDLSLQNPEAMAGSQQASDWIQAGLQRAELEVRTEGDGVAARLNWTSRLAGQVDAGLHVAWTKADGARRWSLGPQSVVRGSLQASTPDMALWSPLVSPPGWRARGQLGLNATVAGTLSQPDWRGELSASELALRSAVEGLEFGNGRLRARLSGERIDIDQLSLEGPGGAQQGGTLTGTGHAQWQSSPAGVPQQVEFRLQANAAKLRVSSRADRRLTLSGEVSATLARQLLQLRGQLAVDQALFVLPDETAPTLGDDVVVRQTRAMRPEPGSRIKTDMLVRIDLGRQLDVRGQGLQTRLGGQVSLISTPRAPALRVIGEVSAQQGSYRAYGQQLRIEEGVVRFSGPYDDPSLNILAVRATGAFRDSDDQVVGVRITGSARAPMVKLYAKPELPDSEKLAWLVLGRPASGTGAEAAVLQQAALALLSRNGGNMDATLASRLGLDEISFRGNSTRADGTTQNAGVAFGKRLSQRLYVVYETGVNAAMGTVSLLYDVSRRLTLRARAGEENAVDLLFTIPHD